jgi:ABC-type transport system substrate-binding protein
VYLDNKEEFGMASKVIKNVLETYGIWVELSPVRTADLNKELTENKETYDMILVGIDLWNFWFNIFPYFHSSQANGGYNFANAKSLNLDVALEELKSNILSPERTLELQKKVLTLLAERYSSKTLYTKEQTYLIDKNIKKFELSNNLNSTLGVNQAILKSYISSERSIILENKSLSWLFTFIKNSFTNNEQ